jgi:hypothetical protein
MSVRGRWRVVETPGYDMAVPSAYILFDQDGGEFEWDGNDEMEEASGHGWAELQDDGSLEGEICLENGDDIPFIARRTKTSSTAC